MPTLIVADLTADAFAPYGEVCTPASVQGRRDHVAKLANQRPDAKANLFLARSGLVTLPLAVTRMENHPHSSQSFLPFADTPIVLVVALPGVDGQPDLATAKAFLARGQGFSYAPGIWHIGVAGLETAVPVAGFMYEDGTPLDCVFTDVPDFIVAAG
jgi:ureidoglycolate lyase